MEDVDVIIPAGIYCRRPFYRLDTHDALASTRDAVELYSRTLSTRYSNVFLVKLRNAIVAGEGAVIAGRRMIVLESMREYLAYGRKLDGLMQSK